LFKYKEPLGGIVGLSGMNVLDVYWNKIDTQKVNKTPILLYHGKDDQMINPKVSWITY
jgi:predicted esterase